MILRKFPVAWDGQLSLRILASLARVCDASMHRVSKIKPISGDRHLKTYVAAVFVFGVLAVASAGVSHAEANPRLEAWLDSNLPDLVDTPPPNSRSKNKTRPHASREHFRPPVTRSQSGSEAMVSLAFWKMGRAQWF
jgi:hypothetical protein